MKRRQRKPLTVAEALAAPDCPEARSIAAHAREYVLPLMDDPAGRLRHLAARKFWASRKPLSVRLRELAGRVEGLEKDGYSPNPLQLMQAIANAGRPRRTAGASRTAQARRWLISYWSNVSKLPRKAILARMTEALELPPGFDERKLANMLSKLGLTGSRRP